ncbi:MAG: GNAT family N-acetyltransferase [Alkaliphilus sp.]
MEICSFTKDNEQFISEAAQLLIESFPHSYTGCAFEEIENCLNNDRIALMAMEDGQLVGFIGAIPQYGVTGWELHPLAVREAYQLKGVGTVLVHALECEVATRGGITIYLGTDDEFNKSSLSDTNLYKDTCKKIENIKNLDKHPYEFYEKLGYKIVGVIPDANGIGKPDIFMSKRIA